MVDHDDNPTVVASPGRDDDRTVIRPTPGRRREVPSYGTGRSSASSPGFEPHASYAAENASATSGALNPLIRSASILLSLAAQLRGSAEHPDVAGLYESVKQEVTAFTTKARAEDVPAELVLAAGYALCTFLDEVVLSTPWGSESVWSHQSLLSTFHKEVWGGEKFFAILEKMSQEAARNLELLELMYVCLALGFQGKYQVIEGGYSALEGIRDNLFRTIRAQRAEFESDLSPHWRGIEDRRNPLVRYVPLWVVGVLSAALLLALYVGFLFSLNAQSDPLFTDSQNIGRGEKLSLPDVATLPMPVVAPEPPPIQERKRLSALLAPEIQAGQLNVTESDSGAIIVIRGEELFRSGSAAVREEYRPLLSRIGQAIGEVEGDVLITGHTDSIPIRTLRFPSNWHLSQARAEAVLGLLAQEAKDEGRFSAEGRSDTEPVASNDTPDGRAQNRRVEIALIYRRIY